jgi:hypothetical protein
MCGRWITSISREGETALLVGMVAMMCEILAMLFWF